MNQSPLHKRAFVRGLNTELIRSGAATYPSKEAADYAADYIADRSGMPDPVTQGEHITLKVAHVLCEQLAQASKALCEQQGGYSPELSKTAAASDPVTVASEDAFAIMQKVAYEVESPNTLESAARTNDAAALELGNRPVGYANDGVGNYEDKGQGAVGVEVPAERGDHVSGNNSATENSSQQKAASEFEQVVQRLKAASNPYTGHPNTPEAAAAHNDQAALDKRQRPAGYAQTGVGKSDLKATGSAVIGAEHAVHPSNSPSGSNSVSQPKTAALVAFEKAASLVLPFLPAELEDRKKVAHISAMLPLSTKGRALYLGTLFGEKVAADFRKHAEEEEEKSDESKEVAKAMEMAAEQLEDKSEDKSEKEASDQRLRDAAARLR